MQGLNKRQKDFLVDIMGKVIVYIATVVIVGKIVLGPAIPNHLIWIFALVILFFVIFSLFLLGENNYE
jgi:hypothetical protein